MNLKTDLLLFVCEGLWKNKCRNKAAASWRGIKPKVNKTVCFEFFDSFLKTFSVFIFRQNKSISQNVIFQTRKFSQLLHKSIRTKDASVLNLFSEPTISAEISAATACKSAVISGSLARASASNFFAKLRASLLIVKDLITQKD